MPSRGGGRRTDGRPEAPRARPVRGPDERTGPIRLFDALADEPEPPARRTARRSSRGSRDRDRERPAPGRRAPRAATGSGPPEDPPIDPRIAARRAEVAARNAAPGARRRRRLALATITVIGVVGAAGLALLSPLVSVRHIEVRGADRTGVAAVRSASGLASGPPLVRVDRDRVAARIAALPWVERARLERRWPGTVVVSVEERHPVAVVPCRAEKAESCLADAGGRVLAASTADPKAAGSLPKLVGMAPVGPPGDTVPDGLRGSLAVAVALPDALRPLVLGIRSEGGEVALDLQAPGRGASPPVVRLGLPERLPDKLTAAATVLARTSVNGIAVLDVRVPESPALTRLRR